MMPMIESTMTIHARSCEAFGKSGSEKRMKPVAAHLQQDAGQDDRARGRGLGVRVREPRVERPHRHLDREGEEEAEEGPELERRRAEGDERLVVECALHEPVADW